MGEGVDPNPRILSERIVNPDALVMGKTAENLHDRYPAITRERVDAYAVRSQDKTAARTKPAGSSPTWSLSRRGPSRARAWRRTTSRCARARPWSRSPASRRRSVPTAR